MPNVCAKPVFLHKCTTTATTATTASVIGAVTLVRMHVVVRVFLPLAPLALTAPRLFVVVPYLPVHHTSLLCLGCTAHPPHSAWISMEEKAHGKYTLCVRLQAEGLDVGLPSSALVSPALLQAEGLEI